MTVTYLPQQSVEDPHAQENFEFIESHASFDPNLAPPPRGRINFAGGQVVAFGATVTITTSATTAAHCANGMTVSGQGFKVPVAGVYYVALFTTVTPVAGQAGYHQSTANLNGSGINSGTGTSPGSATAYTTAGITDDFLAAAGDVFTGSFFNNTGVSVTLNAGIFVVRYVGAS